MVFHIISGFVSTISYDCFSPVSVSNFNFRYVRSIIVHVIYTIIILVHKNKLHKLKCFMGRVHVKRRPLGLISFSSLHFLERSVYTKGTSVLNFVIIKLPLIKLSVLIANIAGNGFGYWGENMERHSGGHILNYV